MQWVRRFFGCYSISVGVGCLLVGCGGTQQTQTDSDSNDSASFETAILSELNRVRSEVTEPANYTGTWAPIPALGWSTTLAISAQDWANTLRDAHNCKLSLDESNSYGETLAYGSVGFGATQAVDLWEEAQAEYAYSPTYQGEAGNYTQVVWRNSTEVGCAMAVCDTGWRVFVCYYAPHGNVINAQPY